MADNSRQSARRGRGQVRVTGGRLRLGLFAVVLMLLCFNALAPWGVQTAHWIFTALQAIVGLAAFVSSLVGDLLWYAGRTTPGGTAPPLAVAIYFLPPLLTLVIAALLVRSGNFASEGRDGPIRGSRVITVLDGLLSTITFSL